MIRPEYEQWAQAAAVYFKESYGLEASFALNCARLYVALWGAGYNPKITSGYRDPSKQAAMRAAWDRGDRAGLRVRPADPKGSQHCKEDFTGGPCATAIDMPCSNDRAAAVIATQIGLVPGISFSVSDPGHYQKK